MNRRASPAWSGNCAAITLPSWQVSTGRIWLHEDLGLAVDIVASFPSRTEKARTVEVADLTLQVEGVEDLIIDRLIAAKHGRSNPKLDIEQATVLLAVFRPSLDTTYVRRRAKEEQVHDYLTQVEEALQ